MKFYNVVKMEYRTFVLHRKLALKCGANVVMPNLSPARHRSSYTLYADKIYTNEETAEKIAIARRNTIQNVPKY